MVVAMTGNSVKEMIKTAVQSKKVLVSIKWISKMISSSPICPATIDKSWQSTSLANSGHGVNKEIAIWDSLPTKVTENSNQL